ncbi:MAG TPA: AMIN domain-containing protein [Desulfomonilaceae bacterium]|nr:AMIN domain-containing protein [Desulfomonilaceae bacterium]
MRSPVTKYKPLWLGCLFLAIMCGSALANSPGEITGVNLDSAKKSLIVTSKGTIGKHSVRVIGNPNRLILDVEEASLGKVPRRVSGGKLDIQEIRVGTHKSSARFVVDFRNMPVPAFHVQRDETQLVVQFGNSLATDVPGGNTALEEDSKKDSSPLAATFVPAAASGMDLRNPSLASHVKAGIKAPHSKAGGDKTEQFGKPAEASGKSGSESRVAQAEISPVRPLQPRPADGPRTRASTPENPGPPAGGPQMVKEVRPPVTPPTPDPRLLVQEITELKFIQVGHNSRLIVRGGDHLDYRLNKVTPTKARLDLVNAEIPKAHQKPLRTDLFSTSVEMIVPGSQTIFIQLKDAVPYQVEKQKGVLMVDFPAPRFTVPPEKAKETRAESLRVIRELEIRRDNEQRRRQIESLRRQGEELQKQKTELIKKYQVTADPEVFGKPVTMDFQAITLKNAFRLLAEQAGVNIVMGEIQGTTTLRLFQVPLGQVIDTILNTHNLDRVMIGNVLRIGSKDEIKRYKDEKEKEYRERVSEIDRDVAATQDKIRETEERITASEKELERNEAAQTQAAETRSEEIADAGCINLEGEQVCFVFTSVKVVFANPADIVTTLECMFNLQCAGLKRAQETLQFATGTGALGTGPGFQQSALPPSSTPGLPALALQDRAIRQVNALANVQRANAIQAIGQGVGAPVGQVSGSLNLPIGTDPKLARIITHSVIAPDQINRMIFLKDTPERVAQMKKVIYSLDVPTPQVLIESRLVQATRDWSRGLGILWGGNNNQAYGLAGGRNAYWGITGNQADGAANTITGQTPTGEGIPTMNPIPSTMAVNLPPTVAGLTNLMGLGVSFGLVAQQYVTQLDLRLQLGEQTGQTKTISRPKVQVLDNQTASIKNGKTIAYSTTSQDGTQTQLVNVDLLLDVTPTIFTDGRIRMRIHVSDNDVGPDLVNGQAEILTREASTVMIVKDGETAVIGGIVRKVETAARQGWPGLMNMPIINVLFSNKSNSKNIQELLVFITPTIVKRPPNAS